MGNNDADDGSSMEEEREEEREEETEEGRQPRRTSSI